jgi:NADH-quinone oxidoreductase subunit E
VPDDALVDLAKLLEMSPADLDGVASFFNMIFRKPVGRHVILLCDSVSCWLLGYEKIQAHLKQRLGIDFGETSADGRFTLLPNQCLGCCDRGPALILDEELHTRLTPEDVDRILGGSD